ncbi:MAG: hypothetical protein M3O09_19280 [Acidobacteriota bacterium]|nr:hypothetical protein [Acidobacteriota bacterium]
MFSDSSSENPANQTEITNKQLRRLAHDLSNSLETILQAGYLLGQSKLGEKEKQWVRLIDTASQDAARINREIRDVLKSQGEGR